LWPNIVIKSDSEPWHCCVMSTTTYNYLNTKLQSQQKLTSDIIWAVRSFEMKLKLLSKQKMLTCVIVIHVLLHKDGSVSIPFATVHSIEMNDSLVEDFKIRFSDFYSHGTNIIFFENLFSIDLLMIQKNCTLNKLKYSMT
jgi:hypothetical protein